MNQKKKKKREDHPRVCGEKKKGALSSDKNAGSPPRVRGKVKSLMPYTNKIRITPACAGKSHSLIRIGLNSEDHPRVCGEKLRKTLVRTV